MQPYPEVPTSPSIKSFLAAGLLLVAVVFSVVEMENGSDRSTTRGQDRKEPTAALPGVATAPGSSTAPSSAFGSRSRQASQQASGPGATSESIPETRSVPPRITEEAVLVELGKLESRIQLLLTALFRAEVRRAGSIERLLAERRTLFACAVVSPGDNYDLGADIRNARGVAYQVFGTKPLEDVNEQDFLLYFESAGPSRLGNAREQARAAFNLLKR